MDKESRKGIYQRIHDQIENTNNLIAQLIKKQNEFLTPQNALSCAAIILAGLAVYVAVIGNSAALDSLNVSLEAFDFDVNAYEDMVEREIKAEKLNELAEVESLLFEITSNYELIESYSGKETLYFFEENGEFTKGDLIVTKQFSVDNITEFLKTPHPLKDEEHAKFLILLWGIKSMSIQINNKILDARLNSAIVDPRLRRRHQKEIFESFDTLYPPIVEAKEKLTEYQKQLRNEINNETYLEELDKYFQRDN